MIWPSRSASWEYPDYSEENRLRWQQAIDEALETGALALTASTDGNSLVLEGSCPRCDHHLRQRVRLNVIRGLDKAKATARANIDCSCENEHEGREGSSRGCGWGGPLPVALGKP